MTTPSGGSQLWNTANPNRINKELPDEKDNTLQIKLRKELDQDEFEALCTITISIDDSTPGITKMKTTKVPLTKYYEFYGYTPATKTYLYTWKSGEPLPNSPKILPVICLICNDCFLSIPSVFQLVFLCIVCSKSFAA